jgi:SET domain-containing protein
MRRSIPKVLIELKPSKIVRGEVGVFAVRNIKKSTIIGKVELLNIGPVFSWMYYKKIDKYTQNKIDTFCLGTAYGFESQKDFNYMNVPMYLNHSCDGNVGFNLKGDFVLIKDVKSGEELSFDYGLAEANPEFKMLCSCKSKSCRKIITGNDWKIFRTSKEKRKYMLPELR